MKDIIFLWVIIIVFIFNIPERFPHVYYLSSDCLMHFLLYFMCPPSYWVNGDFVYDIKLDR